MKKSLLLLSILFLSVNLKAQTGIPVYLDNYYCERTVRLEFIKVDNEYGSNPTLVQSVYFPIASNNPPVMTGDLIGLFSGSGYYKLRFVIEDYQITDYYYASFFSTQWGFSSNSFTTPVVQIFSNARISIERVAD